MISYRLNLLAAIGSLILLLIIIELIRRKYLRERYALIWIGTGTFFLLISLRVEILYQISKWMGFYLPSNALFFLGVLSLVLIALIQSVITSRLAEKNKVLTQEVALLKKRVADLEKGFASLPLKS